MLGVLLGGRADTDVGPFRADMSVSPSLHGGTEVVIPPLGSLTLDSHDGPVHLQIRLGALDQGRTQALIDDPAGITRASRTAVEDVRAGLVRLGVRTLAVSILGALLLSALVFRDVRRTAWSGGLALVVAAASIGVAAGTLRPRSIEEPRYEGLLVNAPAIVGDARRIADDYGRYADQLQRMVANVSRIYSTVSTLPVYEPSEDGARILHVSDLHLNPSVWPMIRSVVRAVPDRRGRRHRRHRRLGQLRRRRRSCRRSGSSACRTSTSGATTTRPSPRPPSPRSATPWCSTTRSPRSPACGSPASATRASRRTRRPHRPGPAGPGR